MKVVLTETIGTLGMVGDIVNVKPGYARNFLFPKKKAILADETSVKQVEHRQRVLKSKIEKAKAEAVKIKEGLDGQEFTIYRKSGGKEKLFGSVTSQDIETELRKNGFEVSRKGILLEQPIKKVGSFSIQIRLDQNTHANISLEVIAENPEPESEEKSA